jgi:hypothetical protein
MEFTITGAAKAARGLPLARSADGGGFFAAFALKNRRGAPKMPRRFATTMAVPSLYLPV